MLKIYYDGNTNLVPEDYVYGIHMKYRAYDDKFYLGATPCREVTLLIDKQAWTTHPSYFRIYDDTTGL